MEKSIKGTLTEQNLLKAFAGESQARNRYEFFAKVASEEGYQQISAIFLLTASQEKAHAKRFFRFLEGGDVGITAMYPAGRIGTTSENLRASAMGEHEEWTTLYPEFAEVAKQEGFVQVASAFKVIARAEAEHEKRYIQLLKNVEEGTVFEKKEKVRWVCRNCGYVHEGQKPPENCPACQHPKAYFEVFDENY
ncbi:MAG: rubrerythrin family protein [Lentimicrobiaceae bacterium]|nr:rubrerythrin family protein [Lentimicrobiaceae bacterium]